MIKKLDNTNALVAMKIHRTFQRSYKIEAKLVGVNDFPPLQRTVDNIAKSTTAFYGYFEHEQLAATIEISHKGAQLEIESLTVDPDHFRKGIAGKLIDYVLAKNSFTRALVETARINKPAIKLYQKHGFDEYKIWTPEHGIEKIALSLTI